MFSGWIGYRSRHGLQPERPTIFEVLLESIPASCAMATDILYQERLAPRLPRAQPKLQNDHIIVAASRAHSTRPRVLRSLVVAKLVWPPVVSSREAGDADDVYGAWAAKRSSHVYSDVVYGKAEGHQVSCLDVFETDGGTHLSLIAGVVRQADSVLRIDELGESGAVKTRRRPVSRPHIRNPDVIGGRLEELIEDLTVGLGQGAVVDLATVQKRC